MKKRNAFWCSLIIILFSCCHLYGQEVTTDSLLLIHENSLLPDQEVENKEFIIYNPPIESTFEKTTDILESSSEVNIPIERNAHGLPWDPWKQAVDSTPFGEEYEKKDKLSFSLMYCFTFTGKRSAYPLTGHTTIASMTYQAYLSEKWGLTISPYIANYSFFTNNHSHSRKSNDFGFDATLSYFLTPTITINLYREQSFNAHKNDFIPLLNPMFPQNRTGLNFEFTKNNATFTIGVERVEYRGNRWER